MTEKRYDDEVLSTILDGEASAETVAAVHNDPVAQDRLEALRSAVDHVARPVPEASPERRSQSIAAAMAAATPASPEVTSLSAQRHKRTEEKKSIPTGWLIATAAAVLAFIVATPFLFNTGEVSDTATDAVADEVTEQASDDGSADVVDQAADEVAGEAMDEEEAMEEEPLDEDQPMAEEEPVDEEAADDEAGDAEVAADEPVESSDSVDLDIAVAASVEEITLLIDDARIVPELAGDDVLALDTQQARTATNLDEVLATEVNPDCLTSGDATPYSLVVLDPFAGPASLIIVEFGNDGTTRLLDAETCELFG